MTISRRKLLKGTASAATVVALPPLAAQTAKTLTVFDSRIPESLAFAKGARLKLDVAELNATRWADLRRGIEGAQRVSGLTAWSDWIVARGLLEEQGLRLKTEAAVNASMSGKAHLFKWQMG